MVQNSPMPSDWARQFFESLDKTSSLLDLFDELPGVYMYIKDSESRFVRANRVVCEVVGVPDPQHLVGCTDFDFFPPAVAAQYVAEDQRVISSGAPLTNQVWLVPGQKGIPKMYLCSKIPLRGKRGEVIGIAGVKRPYEHFAAEVDGYSRLMKVVAYVTENYKYPLEVAELAKLIHLSVSQLQREFSRNFGITPVNYIREVRIGVARHLLKTCDAAVSQIAVDCGFYDQSHFNRHFKSSTGMTPLQYRQRFRQL